MNAVIAPTTTKLSTPNVCWSQLRYDGTTHIPTSTQTGTTKHKTMDINIMKAGNETCATKRRIPPTINNTKIYGK